MSMIVCGSMAFDTIMVFHDHFRNHILPDQVHILNVSFLAPEMRREFGGCAGNIAYNLKLLGAEPIIVAAVGEDAAPYLSRLQQLGISCEGLKKIDGSYTAQAFITTDLDDNQITAFHPGAMMHSGSLSIEPFASAKLGIVAPDGKAGMLNHIAGFVRLGIPFIFDPGQALPLFDGIELLACLKQADFCVMNDYEARLMSERTGLAIHELSKQVQALVVTKGAEGASLYQQNEVIEIPACGVEEVLDPTGCGDAYRAGLMYGIEKGWNLLECARLGAVMGAIKAEHLGGQNHAPTRAQIAERFQATFGYLPW